ncbi:hypothetical protein I7I50_09928 [Histoplasma capsulatum G186AR]|nr:hypothetical protein I7I50_09928 [Histoplasma capsulatum G186AR]
MMALGHARKATLARARVSCSNLVASSWIAVLFSPTFFIYKKKKKKKKEYGVGILGKQDGPFLVEIYVFLPVSYLSPGAFRGLMKA